MTKTLFSEHDLQKQVVTIFRLKKFLTIDTDVMDALKFLGNNQTKRLAYIQEHNNRGYTKGQSDLIIVGKKKIAFVELKTSTGRQSPEQKVFQKEIIKLGFDYYIIRNVPEAIELANSL